MAQIAKEVYWCANANKEDNERGIFFFFEHMSIPTPSPPAEVTLESDLQTAGLVSSVVMASYRVNECTLFHENQQRGYVVYVHIQLCMFKGVCSGVSACLKNQSLLKRIRLKN